MAYHNLDPESRRSIRAMLRWRLMSRNAPPPPADKMQLPPVVTNDGSALRAGGQTLTWVGHASIVLQMDGCTILCDPVWSNKIGGVVPRLSSPGLPFDAIPTPDMVLISHNHYDHLDLPTLRQLRRSTPLLVPNGLGSFFTRRGFTDVREHGWWDHITIGGLQCTFVPAQHWSRRFPWDTNQSWWGGWVIEGSRKVYFGGDSGYFSGFEQIASRFPALDLAILPIGAYEPAWFMQSVHMNPEQAARAWRVLGAEQLLPIHYGTFRLSSEPLGEPPLRLAAWWHAQGLDRERLLLPRIGETLALA
ncbi:MAG: MBL fold metallo-hydrolase [Herpetosiphon sp.]